MRQDRAKDTIDLVCFACLKKHYKPVGLRKLVVVYKGDKVSLRIRQGFIARQRDTLLRFHTVSNLYRRGVPKLKNHLC